MESEIETDFVSVELGSRLGVSGGSRDELREQVALRVLRDLRTLGVERRERGKRPHYRPSQRGERVRALLGPDIEDLGVLLETFIADPGRLHGRREPVQIRIRYDNGSLSGELAELHESGAAGGLSAGNDAGAPAQHRFHELHGFGVSPLTAVVVSDVDLDAKLNESLDGLSELRRGGRVHEEHPLGVRGNRGERGLDRLVPTARASE